MKLYLDSSILVKLFKIDEGSDKVIDILALIDQEKKWRGYTSVWSGLEVARALKKDGKLGELILLDIRELHQHNISFVEIREQIFNEAQDLIASHNIYTSDALHVATFKALESTEKLDGFLCDDAHFDRLKPLLRTLRLDEIKTPSDLNSSK